MTKTPRRVDPGRRSAAVWVAIDTAGGVRKLGKLLGLAPGNISRWHEIPVKHVLAIEKELAIPRHILRPDVYPPLS
jgi:DNA-binding transcriptional regulator YdaS (Cro superfamily)